MPDLPSFSWSANQDSEGNLPTLALQCRQMTGGTTHAVRSVVLRKKNLLLGLQIHHQYDIMPLTTE